ncbi:MAG TPA: DnaJ domain-containing protein [Ktedonobacterales bacterium]|nr:DnaJ domain-containing protein [Ktedonobacterales bacterium]
MNASISDLLDYYGILDVPLDAAQDEITLAFHRLRKQYAADLSARDPEIRQEAALALAELQEAYEVLSDGIRRWLYDQQLLDAMEQATAPRLQMLQATGRAPFGFSRAPHRLKPLPFSPPPQRGVGAFIRRLFIPQANGQKKQAMGVVRKLLLVPIPFCASTIVAALFWHLGQTTGYGFLFYLTAILSYPLILFPLHLRLQWFVRFTPMLSPLQKVFWTSLILIVATLFGWAWFALVDHNGKTPNPLDTYVWLALVMSVCLGLAYL